MVSIAHHRREWMRRRTSVTIITDVGLIGSLMRRDVLLVFTLLILGGLFAVLGTIEKSAEVLQGLPFATHHAKLLGSRHSPRRWCSSAFCASPGHAPVQSWALSSVRIPRSTCTRPTTIA
jgi:hypothetical protein